MAPLFIISRGAGAGLRPWRMVKLIRLVICIWSRMVGMAKMDPFARQLILNRCARSCLGRTRNTKVSRRIIRSMNASWSSSTVWRLGYLREKTMVQPRSRASYTRNSVRKLPKWYRWAKSGAWCSTVTISSHSTSGTCRPWWTNPSTASWLNSCCSTAIASINSAGSKRLRQIAEKLAWLSRRKMCRLESTPTRTSSRRVSSVSSITGNCCLRFAMSLWQSTCQIRRRLLASTEQKPLTTSDTSATGSLSTATPAPN